MPDPRLPSTPTLPSIPAPTYKPPSRPPPKLPGPRPPVPFFKPPEVPTVPGLPEAKPPIFRPPTPPGTFPGPVVTAPYPKPTGLGTIRIGNFGLRIGGRILGPLGAILIAKDVYDLQRELERRRKKEDERGKRENELRRAAARMPDRVIEFPEMEPKRRAAEKNDAETVPILPPAPALPDYVTREIPDVVAPARVPAQAPTPKIAVPTPSIPAPPPATVTPPAPFRVALPTIGAQILSNVLGTNAAKLQEAQRTFEKAREKLRDPTRFRTPEVPNVPQIPNIPNLTRFQFPQLRSTARPSFQPEPSADPEVKQRKDECEVVKRKRRKRGKCREGFFREYSGGTKYVTWRTTNCPEQPGRAAGRVIREFL